MYDINSKLTHIQKKYLIILTISLHILILLLILLKHNNSININDLDNKRAKAAGNLILNSPESSKPELLNAAFVILVRNEELEGIVSSIKQLEDRFNDQYKYPYIFLNNVNFTEEFKDTVKIYTNAEVKFGTIPKEHWSIPSWIDQSKMKKNWAEADYPYHDLESYRHMCRYQSGFFYKHPLVKDLDYYWRVEPDVDFVCNINFDPFRYLKDNNKLYGWTIPIDEIQSTIPTLMQTVDKYIDENDLRQSFPKDNAENFIRNEFGNGYNGCHFWSNFEIASLSIWKSPSYEAFFNYLDKAGGFFYERWGDAPIHSIYLSLFLSIDKLHYFEEIGYRHSMFTHCPLGDMNWENRCKCEQWDSVDLKSWCMIKYWKAKSPVNNRFLGNYLQHL